MSEHESQPAPQKRGFRFTWVSLFSVLAIIGVIVAVVIPSYGDYTHRSQAAEAISLMGSAKTPLAEYYEERKKWPDSLDKVVGATGGKYTRSVAISKGAGGAGEIELTATMKAEGVDRRVAGATIRMYSTDGGKSWTCRAGTAKQNILPASCRD